MSRPWHRRFSVVAVLVACCVDLFGGAVAQAEAGLGFGLGFGLPMQIPVQSFRPAPSTRDFYVTQDATTHGHLVPSTSLYLSYAHRPLTVRQQDAPDLGDAIAHRVNLDLLLAVGLWNRLELGLALPVVLSQGSDDAVVTAGVLRSAVGPGVGDLRLIPKIRLLTHGPLSLAVSLPLSVPTGSRDDLLGDEGVTFAPRAVASLRTRSGFAVGLNAGYRIRGDQSVALGGGQRRLTIDDEVLLSLGFKVPLVRRRLDLVLDGWLAIAVDEQDEEELPAELLAGLRLQLGEGITADVGAGPGLTRGIGAPVVRVFAGLGYRYHPPRPKAKAKPKPIDSDGDGLLDPDDRCPEEVEDKDGFEDGDGCPDTDNDGDGIVDDHDRCVDKAEDKDGFEDDDGCPDPDNDGDGVTDDKDRCPATPEDKDGFEDDDGCPDPDNDGDGILDVKDKCPLEPETFNQVDDEDGCPDKGKGPVQIERGKITIPPVFFANGKDVILKRSQPTLMLVAETLKNNAWVKRVRIEGHTDDRGDDNYNLALSDRRALSVKRFLVGAGIAEARLMAQGFGEDKPVADNKTRAGRAKNRRVALVIVDPPSTAAATAPSTATKKGAR